MGKKSLRFARQGAKVIGMDKREIEISEENFEFKEKYALIISSMVLHFFKEVEAKNIIMKTRENTVEEGFNFLIYMFNRDDCSKAKSDNFYPTLEELKEIYSDWEITKEDNYFTDLEEHDDLSPHRHNLIFLLVKKPTFP